MTVSTGPDKFTDDTPTVGWREWLSLPQLNIPRIKAKIDTGARTSSLHAVDLEFGAGGDGDLVSFVVHPQQHHRTTEIRCVAPLIDRRDVINSGGQAERRPVILTQVAVGPYSWDIEITLTERAGMRFRMLLGRHALRRRFLVDPGRSYLIGARPKKKERARQDR